MAVVMRLLIFMPCLLGAFLQPALAQVAFPPAHPVTSIVTILSDGLSEQPSPASQVVDEISVTLDRESPVRVLSVNGYGGPTNVRDLLQLRGADLAVVNNDVLAWLDLAKALPEARKKIRMVAPLFTQGVFLFGREPIQSVDDLRGKKIGVPSSRPSRGVTAKTVFGLLKIKAEIIELNDRELAKRAQSDLDAVMLYGRDLKDLPSFGITPASHHLLSLPTAGPLATVYMPKKIGKNAIGSFTSKGTFETIQVSSLLAAFDWNSKQVRYAEVSRFVEKFFGLLPKFRERFPDSPFSRTDVRVALPGWKYFGPAEALAAAAPQPVAKETALALAAPPVTKPLVTEQTPHAKEKFNVLAVARPPLTNAQEKDGGVALKIFTDAMAGSGVPVSIQWVNNERAMLDGVVVNKTADAGFFWQTPHCDAPSHQTVNEAELCDRAVLSEPLMQAVIAVFTRVDMPLNSSGSDVALPRTLCIPESQPVPEEAIADIHWISGGGYKALRPKTLIDCLAAVDGRQADALIAIEPEARYAIEKLKLSQLQLSLRANVTAGLHAIVAKDNPRQAEFIQTINQALAKFKSSGGYASVMASHLAALTGASTRP